MFLVLMIIAAVLVVLAIVLKNWILGAASLACVILALMLGRGVPTLGVRDEKLGVSATPIIAIR